MRRFVRLHVPLTLVAIAVAAGITLALGHHWRANTGTYFALWMVSGLCCAVPLMIFVAVDARRMRAQRHVDR
jgi:EamA domain-containing membrane protein RarD